MSVSIPVTPVPTFDPHGDPTSVHLRWKKWIRSFETYSAAAGCTDKKQKRQLLLHSAGPEVQDIFETLVNTGDDFDKANEKLTEYFTPLQNIPFNRHVFRQASQSDTETITQFVTRLRQLAVPCDFGGSIDDFIRDQVIDKCRSKSLRTKFLAEKTLTLAKVLEISSAVEASESRSAQFNETDRAFAVGKQKFKKPARKHNGKPQEKTSKPTSNPKASTDKCSRCGQKGHTGPECRCSKNIKCFKCGKMGHFASMCRSEKVRYAADTVEEVKDESSESDYGFCTDRDSKLKSVTVNISGQEISMIVDSGASCDIINTETKNMLKSSGVQFRKSSRIIHPYCSPPIKASVQAAVTMVRGSESVETEVICLEGDSPPLLGRKTAEALHVLTLESVYLSREEVGKLEKQHPGVTKGIGKLKGHSVKLHVDSSVPPVARKQIRIPFHLRPKVDAELDRLLKEDIIEEVSGPTEWVSPVVIVEKPKSKDEVRICVDMREPNKAILRTRHVTPTIDELTCTLRDAKLFSKIDLRSGYHQLELDPSSRAITTFATHRGLFRYKRLIFGVNAAAEIFQHAIQTVIADVKGAFNVSDDIIVFGSDKQSHDSALENTLKKLHENGLTINAQKCKFSQTQVTFYGHVFSGKGISPDPEKVKALHESQKPQSAPEVRSFLGMAQYSARYIPNFSTITAPLRELTKNNAEWQWTDREETAFNEVKSALSENATTAYFDPHNETTIYVDASPVGLAGILTQDDRVIMYASRSLTAVESRYSQTEREALAVVWACEHYNVYINGAPVTIVTDHQPLLGIWNKPKQTSLRIARWGLRLQPYCITLKYKPGKENPADFMSRHPVNQNETNRASRVAEDYVNFVVRESKPKAIDENQVRTETNQDKTLQTVIKLLKSGKWSEIDQYKDDDEIDYQALQSFRSVKDELTISESQTGTVLLRKTRVVIPRSLQRQTIDLAHEGHQGITKTKSLLRSKVWFPMIDKMVEDAIARCIPCEANTNRQIFEPLKMSPLPRGPWQKLSIDFCGPTPTGDYLLVIIDEFSRYPIVYVVRSTSAETIMPLLDQTFALFGYPETIKSDNGPPFQSHGWTKFLNDRGIKARHITPLWPQANAQAENFNKPMLKAIRAAIVAGQNWKYALTDFLRVYRMTPHSTTLFTPYRLLFGRDPKTKLPESDTNEKHPDDAAVRARDCEKKERMKEYADARRHAKETLMETGDIVMMKRQNHNKTQSCRYPQPLIVSKVKGPMITAQHPDGREVTRNKSFFRSVPNVPPETLMQQAVKNHTKENISEPEPEAEVYEEPSLATGNSKPRRIIRKPKRLIEEI